nr:hypothetical protein KXZ65_20375 [Pectobacterium sp. PL152]
MFGNFTTFNSNDAQGNKPPFSSSSLLPINDSRIEALADFACSLLSSFGLMVALKNIFNSSSLTNCNAHSFLFPPRHRAYFRSP